MRRILILLTLLCIGTTAYAKPVSENEKIAELLNAIGTSQVTFIRSGKEYTGAQAKDHLQMKLENAGARVTTADDFITYIASKSSLSGKPYYIRLSDNTTQEAEKWLHERLAEIEAR